MIKTLLSTRWAIISLGVLTTVAVGAGAALALQGGALVDHCGRPFVATGTLQDDEGSVLFASRRTVALLDDRDLARFAADLPDPPPPREVVRRLEVATRYGFVADPKPG